MRIDETEGFTLIEVIMVILLIGIISVFSFLFIVTGVSGFVTAKENTELAQKVGMAMERITKEFTDEMKGVDFLDPANPTTDKTWIKYTYTESPDSLKYRHLRLVGSGTRKQIVLVSDDTGTYTPSEADDEVLLDNVSSLAVTFTDYDGNPWAVSDGIEALAEIGVSLVVFVSDADDTTLTFQLTLHPAGREDLISLLLPSIRFQWMSRLEGGAV